MEKPSTHAMGPLRPSLPVYTPSVPSPRGAPWDTKARHKAGIHTMRMDVIRLSLHDASAKSKHFGVNRLTTHLYKMVLVHAKSVPQAEQIYNIKALIGVM